MAGKRDEKRKALRDALISAAHKRIMQDGSSALRARDLAKDVGCAVGAIYNAFEDLDDLQFYVRAQIFSEMVDWISEKLDTAKAEQPKERLCLMALYYYQFAQDHRNAWSALFATGLDMSKVPQWYLNALEKLLGHVTDPLSTLAPALPDAEIRFIARILFSSVHGITVLTVQQRPSGMTPETIPKAFDRLISAQILDLT